MCIEVAADDGTRILLDLSMPLQTPGGGDFPRGTPQRPTEELIAEGVLVGVPAVFLHDLTAPDLVAIVLMHSHLDYCGLAHHAHPEIPVYGSRGTLVVLDVGRVFLPDAALPADLRLLPDDEPLRFGGLTVTAIPVDHAASDSRAMLCVADGHRLLCTGDLRAHGRTGFRFESEHPRSQASRRFKMRFASTLSPSSRQTSCNSAAAPCHSRSASSCSKGTSSRSVARRR
jgi:ribonuclease J